MFDLPVQTVINQRAYRIFRKFLIKSGFIMLQESIYAKLSLNPTAAEQARNAVRKNVPKDGLIFLMTITEKQFQNMEILLGGKQTLVCDTDKRLVEL